MMELAHALSQVDGLLRSILVQVVGAARDMLTDHFEAFVSAYALPRADSDY